MSPRVALFGEFGIRNFGNEACLAREVEVLRRHGWGDLVVVCHEPASVVAEHGLPAVAMTDPAPRGGSVVDKALAKVRDMRWMSGVVAGVDLVVVPGTGILEGRWTITGAIPFSLFTLALACRRQRCPLVVLSVGTDDEGTTLARWFFRATARAATYLSARDARSVQVLSRLSGRGDVLLRPDLVLGQPVGAPAGQTAAPALTAPFVVVGVLDYAGERGDRDAGGVERAAYVDRLGALVRGLGSRGLGVRLMTGDRSDESLVGELVGLLAAEGVAVEVATVASMAQVRSQTAGAVAMIASRYHNLVAALLELVPTVSIGYGAKQQDLLADMGLSDYAVRLDTFDAEDVLARFDRLLADRDGAVATIAARLAQAQVGLAEQDALVDALMVARLGRPLDAEAVA